MFRIASFAELAGASPKVLRDYDRRGIFRPAWVDPDSGYRSYSPAQIPEIRRILALRDLGIGLDELERLVTDRADLRGSLERRRTALETARREIDRRLTSLGIALADGPTGAGLDVVVRTLRPERVATLDVATVAGHDVGRAFYELERLVRDAGARAPRPPGALLDRIGGLGTVEVFVPVRQAAPSFASRSLPACRAATIIRRGPYADLPVAWHELEAWVRDAGLMPAGPARILYLQFGAEADLGLPARFVVADDADYLTELQVPVA